MRLSGELRGNFGVSRARSIDASHIHRRTADPTYPLSWIASKRPRATREELEVLASQYHLGRQQVTGAAVCCDVETRDHCAGDGWNTFHNKSLEESCLKLTGRPIKIG